MADSDEKYTTKTISNDPADYITGPRKGQANRGHGGTTQDGSVQVLNVEEPDDNPGQTEDSPTGNDSGQQAPPAPAPTTPVDTGVQRSTTRR